MSGLKPYLSDKMKMVDLYGVLGLSRNADSSEIRTAYKQLAKEHHPDKGGNPEKFKEINQAHEILSDDARRKMYDMTGNTSEQPEHNMGPFGPGNGNPFGGGFAGFSQMFGGMFPGGHPGGHPGGQSRRREGKSPGKSQDIPLRISDYYNGRNLSIKLGRQVFCKSCKGSGALSTKQCDPCGGNGHVRQVVHMGPIQMVAQTDCNNCGGSGQQKVGQCNECQGRSLLHEEKTLEIKVEPGMMSGNTVVFSGMCSDHPQFTEAGDVTVILREAEEDHPASSWVREGTKLKTSITINLTDALVGTTKVLQGHPGYTSGLTIEIPVGVQNMWTGTFPGLGMPIRGTPKFGEAYITVLVIPTSDEIAALKAQNDVMKSFMPSSTSSENPQTVQSVQTGRWAAV